jgi:hypothetical protein
MAMNSHKTIRVTIEETSRALARFEPVSPAAKPTGSAAVSRKELGPPYSTFMTRLAQRWPLLSLTFTMIFQ